MQRMILNKMRYYKEEGLQEAFLVTDKHLGEVVCHYSHRIRENLGENTREGETDTHSKIGLFPEYGVKTYNWLT